MINRSRAAGGGRQYRSVWSHAFNGFPEGAICLLVAPLALFNTH